MLKNISSNKFQNLIEYYIKCIEREDMLSLTFNFKSDGEKFHSNIFQKEQFFFEKKEQVVLKKSKILESFINDYKLVEKNKSLFYGYPITLDASGKVSPIFFTEIFYDENQDDYVLTKVSPDPEFNHYILQKEGFKFEEIEKIRMELDEEDSFISQLEKITNFIKIDNKHLKPELQKEKLTLKPQLQIINKAIVYSGARTGIVYNLLSELTSLKKQSQKKISSSSLSIFFKNESNDVKNRINHPIIEVFPMNYSQEQAVKNAFQKQLSVVTGPPGTGKSQVVLNIISNAVVNNKTVLFASKNNKAVDVVIDKFNSIFPENTIVRMGSRQFRRSGREKLENLIKKKDKIKLPKLLDDCVSHIEQINHQLNSIHSTINSMAELNTSIDTIYSKMNEYLKDIPVDLIVDAKNESFEMFDQFKIESDIQKLLNDDKSFLIRILKRLFPNWYNKRIYKILNRYFSKMPKSFRKYANQNVRLQREDVIETLQLLLSCIRIDALNKQVSDKKRKLAELPSLTELNVRLNVLQKQRLNLSKPLFKYQMISKLKNLEIREENHVSRYFDASEKLEKYIESIELWRWLDADQKLQMTNLLKHIPIWVVTNLSARNSIPFENNLFDILIIDEASQCDIASAIPLIFRAKNIVIIGDPKQLKHISLLKDSQDKKYASEHQIEELYLDFSYSKNSLYDLAERMIKEKQEIPKLLTDHYRSHIDIINFSNEYFYDNKLNILTNIEGLVPDKYLKNRFSWDHINGKTIPSKSPYCLEEANRVVNQIISMLELFKKSKASNVSFGVVTLFRAQMELIDEKIKKSNHLKDMDITVGTAHRFQGDEKDIIIFSPAVSNGAKQTTINWISSTQQLLNVAITRARSGLVIVGNKQKCLESKGILKDLVEYSDVARSDNISFDSNIEKIFYEQLEKNNIRTKPQYWTKVRDKKAYRLDFALFVKGQKYDIEVDGDKAHSHKDDYDILRDIHLRMDGWKIRRYDANQIQNNLDKVVEEIKRLC